VEGVVVTVRVTTLKGVEAGRYYTERLSSYYLDGGEPPGRWWGAGARDLGLSGDVDPEAFLALMAGDHPTTGHLLGRRYGKASVRGYDATFSAPKSVSLLCALGGERTQREVLAAHDQAVDAVLGWIESHAHTRLRRNGHVVCVDAEGLVVGMFRQHTSRRLDPQLHTHAVIANRVKAPDGRWLALDARTIKIDQRTLSSLYHANLRSELTGRLGVEWRQPENGIAEIEGIPDDVLAEFSQRSRDVDRRLTKKVERFRDTMGRDPSDRERWRLEREAVLDSRPAKPHNISLSQLRDHWRQRTLDLGYNPDLLFRGVVRRRIQVTGLTPISADRLAETALAALEERQSSWRPAELVRELASAIPTTTSVGSADLIATVDRLAVETVGTRCVDISRPKPTKVKLRRDSRPITEPAVDCALTTRTILTEEEELVAWARRRQTTEPIQVRRLVSFLGRDLSAGQVAAASATAGRGELELIVGPAGAGKTTALSVAAKTLKLHQRTVFGVAPTATAAEVLASETGMAADTLDKLLHEHSQSSRPTSAEYDLPAGTTLIVDEAGTVSTPKLAELARLADEKKWRVVLVGDPRQLTAVGRGGMFGHLVDTLGAVELDEIHRFTQNWEKQASLRLRAGDPTVLDVYDQHGRIHSGSVGEMETQIVEAWGDARAGGNRVALMANSNDTVNRLNIKCQQLLLDTGSLQREGRSLKVGDQILYEGDEVVTRRNDRTLRTSLGLMVKNRDHWTIQQIHSDGTVTLTGQTGTVTLPADYVTGDVELGYAQTSHTSQGRTVDTALLLVDTPTDSRGIYTPMTRGRHANHAYVITEINETALTTLTTGLARDWTDQPALAHQNLLTPSQERQGARRPSGLESESGEHHKRSQQALEHASRRAQEQTRSLGLTLSCPAKP
jgi:conjugative relaxase-like TrwC/TraI family protein